MNETLLNMIPNSCAPEVHLSQYDNGRGLRVALKEGNAEYQAPSGAVVKVKATKPSGLGFIVSGTITDGNIVTVTNTETMTNEAGRFPAELSIESGTTLLGTSNFVFNIERSPHPEGTIDGDAESLLPELTLLVERIEDSNARIESMTASATPLPSGQNPTANYNNTTNTLELGIPVADRQYITVDGVNYPITSITKTVVDEVSGLLVAYGTDSTVFIPDGVGVKNVAQFLQTQINGKVSAVKLNGDILTPHYDSAFGDGVVDLGTISDDTKADAIVKSASGSIASFSDGGDNLPMKSLKVNIVPKQSGSGDPSPTNIRAISGWDSVAVEQSGKNLFNPNLVVGPAYVVNADGSIKVTASDARGWSELNPIPIKAGTYTFSWLGYSNGAVSTIKLSTDGYTTDYYLTAGTPRRTITMAEDGYFKIKVGTSASSYPVTVKLQLEVGSTATDYEPYEGETITTNLGQTVYGGELDVVSGKLVLNKAMADLGSLNWSYDGTRFYTRDIASLTKGYAYNVVADAISSIYKADIYSNISSQSVNNIFVIGETGTLSIKNTAYTTASAFKTAMNGVQLVYELATPTEIQLTPTEVKSLLGANNVWSESGTVEVEYRADTTLAYNELVAMILENMGN